MTGEIALPGIGTAAGFTGKTQRPRKRLLVHQFHPRPRNLSDDFDKREKQAVVQTERKI